MSLDLVYDNNLLREFLKIRTNFSKEKKLVGWLIYQKGKKENPVPFYGSKIQFKEVTKSLRDKNGNKKIT